VIKKITVTLPFLPELEEFIPYLEDIWQSRILTNNGKYHKELEQALCDYLGVKFISLFSNGTIALITALQELRITGEVITTPFSFVATTHALWWNGINPVFVDVDERHGNLNPDCIEAAITNKTTAIMPVHVYGHPCKTEEIQKIADRYNLKVIYDAAHAFGVKRNDKSVLNEGDLSVLSFHATKVFNTFEGGAIVCKDLKTKERIDHLKNFGFSDELTVIGPGINGKMNEFQAALGLLQLKHIEMVISRRKKVFEYYLKKLQKYPCLDFISPSEDVSYNYAYFPLIIDESVTGIKRDILYEKLKEGNIYSRRYFYPLISNFPSYSGLPSSSKINLSIANKLADQVVCLPIYPDLSQEEQGRVIEIIEKSIL
jgi:dTDP-4-amino-4,6-dideoxygalactose transaminase